MANEPHLNRKDLKQPDEFQTAMARGVRWLDANRQLLSMVGVAIVGVTAVVAGLRWNGARQAEAAARVFRTAQTAFKAERFAEAATQFETIGTEYPRTSLGKLARLYRARALARGAEAAAAATAFEEYLASSPAAPALRQDALVGLGRAQERAGNATAALDAYTQAADVAGPLTAEAALGAARLHATAGDAAKAEGMYRKALAGLDDGDLKTMVLAKLPPDTATP